MFWHGAGKLAELNISAAVRVHNWKSKLAFCRRRPGHGAKLSCVWITVWEGRALQVPEAPTDTDNTSTQQLSLILAA